MAATIDALAWSGAGAITAAQKATIIFDNKTKNVITLGAGKDTVNITNTNTGKATATVVDQIIGVQQRQRQDGASILSDPTLPTARQTGRTRNS